MKIKAIIFGSTGMVGEGVLHECLLDNRVESVLVINRKPCGVNNPKLKEIILIDFNKIENIKDQLIGYNACYFCMGVSSVGMSMDVYKTITYNLTLNIAKLLVQLNEEMTFCYVSGSGTDSSEKGKLKWARIKGKTENDLLKLPFKGAYMFRPGYIQPTKGLKHTYKIYKVLAPFYPLFKLLFNKYVCTLEELGKAMINVTLNGAEIKVLECVNIHKAAK